jgi:hypothetical protein
MISEDRAASVESSVMYTVPGLPSVGADVAAVGNSVEGARVSRMYSRNGGHSAPPERPAKRIVRDLY